MREAVGLSAINEYLKVKKKIMMKVILTHWFLVRLSQSMGRCL
jgi:hypothetical protein